MPRRKQPVPSRGNSSVATSDSRPLPPESSAFSFVTISSDDSEDSDVVDVAILRTVGNGVARKTKRKVADNAEYDEVEAMLGEFDFYLTVATTESDGGTECVRTNRTIRVCLKSPLAVLPERDTFWVYVSEAQQRCVVYFEWLSHHRRKNPATNLSRSRRVVDKTECLEALPVEDAKLCSLVAASSSSIKLLLRSYNAASGVIVLELRVLNKMICKLDHPSDLPRRPDKTFRDLMCHIFNVDVEEYSYRAVSSADTETLYMGLAEFRRKQEEVNCDKLQNTQHPQHPQLLPSLRPYQIRAVRWMLKQECQSSVNRDYSLHSLYKEVELDGSVLYLNMYGGWLVRERPLTVSSPPGGILADEMGLGKTVEILSLVLCNPRLDVPKIEPREVFAPTFIDKSSKKKMSRKRQLSGASSGVENDFGKTLITKASNSIDTRGKHEDEKACESSDDEPIYRGSTLSREERMKKRTSLLNPYESAETDETKVKCSVKNVSQKYAKTTKAKVGKTKLDTKALRMNTETGDLSVDVSHDEKRNIGEKQENDEHAALEISFKVVDVDGGTKKGDTDEVVAVTKSNERSLSKQAKLTKLRKSTAVLDPADSYAVVIDEVVVRMCYGGRAPKLYRPGVGVVRPARLSVNRQLANALYQRELAAVDWRQRRDAVEQPDPAFSCLCGRWNDSQKRQVECEMCGTRQHADCVGYDLNNALRGPYCCPQCWTRRAPLASGATLIVSPGSISSQWVSEIHKHIRCEGLRVLVYTGVRSDRYIQPQTLASHDLVVTTYTVLQKEINYVDVGRAGNGDGVDNVRQQRRVQRYMSPPTPLLRVQWWRVCLDEAQMVECTTTRTSEMALKLNSVNRWCVTGTPISRSVGDIRGLLLFLGLDPMWQEQWWNQCCYFPYLNGVRGPLQRVLERCFWRSAKTDVADQINIPPQEERVTWLNFSPVESYFYRWQQSKWTQSALQRISKYHDTSVMLHDMDYSSMDALLRPLLHLRQACCHPQIVRGQFVPLTTKSAMTMSQLLDEMVKRATTDAEDAHRLRNAAMCGLAALHIVQQEWEQAADLYRTVLRLAEELAKQVKTDLLQRLHVMHNLHEILSAGHKIPPTVRDGQLTEQTSQLRTDYLSKHDSFVDEAKRAVDEVSEEVERQALASSGDSDGDGASWFSQVILAYERCHPGTLVAKINDELMDLSNRDKNAERKAADLGTTKRSKVLKSRPPTNTMLNKFTNAMGLEHLLAARLDEMERKRFETRQAVLDLFATKSSALVDTAVDCHLRTTNSTAKDQEKQCAVCQANEGFSGYERQLFYMKPGRVESSHVVGGIDGNIQVHGELQRGNWSDNETGHVLKVLLSLGRQLYGGGGSVGKTLLQQGAQHLRMLDAMKKEFRQLRALWRRVSDRVSAYDELNMATLRLRLRYEDEEVPDMPVSMAGNAGGSGGANQMPIYVIEPHELDQHTLSLQGDRMAAESELRRRLGQRLYLTNLQKRGDSEEFRDGGNPDSCPICDNRLGASWSVMECGHCFCIACIQTLIEQYSCGGRRGLIRCAVCRDMCSSSHVAYVRCDSSQQENSARLLGNHSTKVEGVVRCVLDIVAEEPQAKALVFSTWSHALCVAAEALEQNGVVARRLDAAGKFQQHLHEFRSDPSVQVLLLPVHSGARGLNLIEATHVILMNPVLDPSAELQAVGRVHRIGQTRRTVVHRLLVRDTIEERIHALIASRDKSTSSSRPPLAEEDTGLTLAELRSLFSED